MEPKEFARICIGLWHLIAGLLTIAALIKYLFS